MQEETDESSIRPAYGNNRFSRHGLQTAIFTLQIELIGWCNELRPLQFLYLLFYLLWPFRIRAAWVDDLISFLQHYVVFSGWLVFSPSAGPGHVSSCPGHVSIAWILTHVPWHMVPHLLVSFFSKCLPRACKFRPRACTYRLDPDSCSLAYGTTPFGPIEYQQLFMDVSCASLNFRCIASHKPAAYTLSVFKIMRRTMQPSPSCFGISNHNAQGLNSPTWCILLYFSSKQGPKIWITSTTYRPCVWQSALHHMGKQCPGEPSTLSSLTQLHLLPARRPMMRTIVPPSCRRIPSLSLMTQSHPWNHRR